MYLTSYDHNNHPTSIKRGSISFKNRSFLQFSDISWPYFDHTFASEKPQNDYTPIQMVSNESL